MKVNLEPGKYIVAVSGGVDSVVLLDMLTRLGGLELIVAHYDHGIREDSAKTENWLRRYRKIMTCHLNTAKASSVQKPAKRLLGKNVMDFYELFRKNTAPKPSSQPTTKMICWRRPSSIYYVVPAAGDLSSLRSTTKIRRPLLGFAKAQIIDYAKNHSLTWHEDSTNQDETYLRNWVR